jgi:hypothetical protein
MEIAHKQNTRAVTCDQSADKLLSLTSASWHPLPTKYCGGNWQDRSSSVFQPDDQTIQNTSMMLA